MTKTLIKTTCSSCATEVRLDTVRATATTTVPSNGKRGSLHVAGRTAVAPLDGDDDLLTWDCPSCEHADSFDLND